MTTSIPKYTVLDVETTIHNDGPGSVGTKKADPNYPSNRVVYCGKKDKGSSFVYDKGLLPSIRLSSLLVGHNIKFDLLYSLKEHNLVLEDFKNTEIWDTMIVEYLLSGQTTKFVSLDELSKKYGGTIKNEKIKEYWEAGISTEHIPENEIIPYLKQDVENTEKIFLTQWKKANRFNMLPLIKAQMKALLATTIMERNGMHFDVVHALDIVKTQLQPKLKKCEEHIITRMEIAGIQEPNPASNQHISLLIFGGVQEVDVDVNMRDDKGNVIRYKSGKNKGKVRTRKGKESRLIPALSTFTKGEWESSVKDIYKVNNEVLTEIHNSKGMSDILLELIENILAYRQISKDISTYFVGFSKLLWTHDDCIHGTINHCATATGRLSSSSPNLQNLTSKDS